MSFLRSLFIGRLFEAMKYDFGGMGGGTVEKLGLTYSIEEMNAAICPFLRQKAERG